MKIELNLKNDELNAEIKKLVEAHCKTIIREELSKLIDLNLNLKKITNELMERIVSETRSNKDLATAICAHIGSFEPEFMKIVREEVGVRLDSREYLLTDAMEKILNLKADKIIEIRGLLK